MYAGDIKYFQVKIILFALLFLLKLTDFIINNEKRFRLLKHFIFVISFFLFSIMMYTV